MQYLRDENRKVSIKSTERRFKAVTVSKCEADIFCFYLFQIFNISVSVAGSVNDVYEVSLSEKEKFTAQYVRINSLSCLQGLRLELRGLKEAGAIGKHSRPYHNNNNKPTSTLLLIIIKIIISLI